MKRVFTTILLLLMALASLVFLGPAFFHVQQIKTGIVEKISAETGWEIKAEEINWYWLPAPHFSIFNTALSRSDMDIILPELRIYLGWRSLFQRKAVLGRITLYSPRIRLRRLPHSSPPPTKKLPRLKISVLNGELRMPGSLISGDDSAEDLLLSKVQALLEITSDELRIEMRAGSSLARESRLRGYYDIKSRSFAADYELNDFQPAKLLPDLAKSGLSFLDSSINLKGKIRGDGSELVSATITGELPSLALSGSATKSFLGGGLADLEITSDRQGIVLKIKQLSLENPELKLSGLIARQKPPSPTSASDNRPVWLLDLTGTDIDAGEVRSRLLKLWPRDHLVKLVTDIVLDGLVSRASYYFKGPVDDFKRLEKMKITAEVKTATIHPPATPLVLTAARGPITIIDGYLQGHNLAANFRGSTGENCMLYLDLLARDHAFNLDLDLVADLADLPGVLHNLVANQTFKNEVNRFTQVRGRAAGHLKLGEKLNDLAFKVRVDSMKGGAAYERIHFPFVIHGGSLTVDDKRVKWQRVSGETGPHLIHESSGEVNWFNEVMLDLKSLDATLDGSSFLAELSENELLPEQIRSAIQQVDGPLELKNLSIKGPVANARKWRYSFELNTQGSRWRSGLLPQPVLVERARAKITNKSIDITESKLWFFEQPLMIDGGLTHQFFKDFQGWFRVSGSIRENLANWVREKEFIPPRYFPRIPCTLEKFKVKWSPDSIKLAGTIRAGFGEEERPRVRINLDSARNRLTVHELVFTTPDEIGSMRIDQRRLRHSTQFSWQGFLSGATLAQLLPIPIHPEAHLEGDFVLILPGGSGGKFFEGWMKLKNYYFPREISDRQLLIESLKVSGNRKGRIKLAELALTVDEEKVVMEGDVETRPAGMSLDLKLKGEKLSHRTIHDLIDYLEHKGLTGHSPSQRGRKGDESPSWELDGKIDFNIANFVSRRSASESLAVTSDDQNSRGYQFSMAPANGSLSITPEQGFSVDLNSSKICGLDISGVWHSPGSRVDNSFNIFTDSESPPRFEEVLSCLGVEQDLIQGAFHLDAKLTGNDTRWRNGSIYLYSDNGRIRQLNALSKIFRFINLTDIISGGGLPDLDKEGFGFSKLDVKSHVEDNRLIIDHGVILGEGLNLFAQGTIALQDQDSDIVLMIAPLKTLDTLVTSVPLVGPAVAGKNRAILSIPIAIKGKVYDPDIKILPAKEVGKGILNLIGNTLMIPFIIFNPEKDQF